MMGHKTDMRRYSRSIAAVARGRAARPAPALADSPEIEMCRQELGLLTISDPRYAPRRARAKPVAPTARANPVAPARTWIVLEF